MFTEKNREKEGSKQIRRICMFIEKDCEMEGTTPAGVESLVHNDVSINM
jgi:hypothetical protein